jgi:hypothetical protein
MSRFRPVSGATLIGGDPFPNLPLPRASPPMRRPAPVIREKSQFCAQDDSLSTKMTKLREMIEFLAQMPTDTKIFLTMAVLGLATVLIVLRLT